MDERLIELLEAADIDHAAAMEHFEGDEALYMEYLYRFCEDENYDRVVLYLNSGKTTEALQALQMLGKVAGSLGLCALCEGCAALEKALQAQKGVGVQADCLQSIFGQTLAAVLHLLQQWPSQ